MNDNAGMCLFKWTYVQVKSKSQLAHYYISERYTLNSVTGSGHVKHQKNHLACKLHGNSAWKMYLLLFKWPVIISLAHGVSTATKHGKWSYKRQKRDWPCILHGRSQSCY